MKTHRRYTARAANTGSVASATHFALRLQMSKSFIRCRRSQGGVLIEPQFPGIILEENPEGA